MSDQAIFDIFCLTFLAFAALSPLTIIPMLLLIVALTLCAVAGAAVFLWALLSGWPW